MMLMAKSTKNKRRAREKRVLTPPEGIAVYTTSAKFRKEERESKEREQEAARESD